MAVIALNAAQLVSDAGLAPPVVQVPTAVDTYTFPNDGKTLLYIEHGAGASNVTIITPGTVRGKAIADAVVALAISGRTLVGPFPPDLYNDASGLVTISFSEVTGAGVAVVRLP
jgi:hypothetical protein